MDDYKDRSYLSAVESARYLGITVTRLHELVKNNELPATRSASGQFRFTINALKNLESFGNLSQQRQKLDVLVEKLTTLEINDTLQKIFHDNSQAMTQLDDDSIHLMLTSPPYFNAKMYSKEPLGSDLGNIHDLDEWFDEIGKVWSEVFRVLQPGRKAFINIMNLPVRINKGFRSLNLVGKTIDLCEELGFIFKRDIVWQKTNSVRAHFGTYPYPGSILLNHAHEFIIEFEKPALAGVQKYGHLTQAQKDASKLDKEFWTSIKKSDVWLMKPEGSGDRRSHAAPFPYMLPFRLIKAYSYVGETVLDPFMGSGTALLAARDLKRNGIGYEINPEITAEAIERIKNFKVEK